MNELRQTVNELKNKELTEKDQPLNLSSIEQRLKILESKMEDVQLALELIKQYGFNPKEYNEMITILK